MTIVEAIGRIRGNVSAQHTKAYRKLLHKDAGGGQLTSPEVAQLDTAAAELGISTEQVADDTAALRRRAELTEQLKHFDRDFKALRVKTNQLGKKFREFTSDELEKVIRAWKIKGNDVRLEAKKVARQMMDLQIAKEELTQLEQEPRLFSDASQDVLAESKRRMQQAKAGRGWVL